MKGISKKWIILSFAVILFLSLTYFVMTNQIDWLDNLLYQSLQVICNDTCTDFFLVVTNLVHPMVVILITIILIIFIQPKKLGIWAFINLCVATCANVVLKGIFMRQRPINFLLFKESGYSYPSAHSMVGCCFYGFLIYLIWQSHWKKISKIISSIILGIIIILIGISRIYFRVHYPSDVLAGFSISLVYLILFTHIMAKKWS